jgi:hypothetical protein
MVLGDGYAFGNGLSIGETIPERLDVELKQSSNGVNFVVLNAAMPGYGIGDVIAYMNEKGNKLRPYIVILFITNSDIWETLRPGLIRECGRSTTKSLWKRIIWFFGSEEAYNVHLNIFSRNRKKQKIAGFNLPRDKLSELAFIKFKDSFKEFKSLVNSYGGRLLAVLVATEPPQLEPFLIEESVPFIKTREIIRCHAPGRENYAQELCKNPDLPDWYLEDGHFGPRSATVIAKDIFKWIEKNVSGVGSN